MQETTTVGATLNTDEWQAYNRLPELGRDHVTVNHGEKEWARADGDGVREVHTNTWKGRGRGSATSCGRFAG